jgi:hypothetical protein
MPPFPADYYEREKQIFTEEYDSIGTICSIDLIGRKERYIFAKKFFYDAVFHLNGRGRNLRTDLLIQDLEKWMSRDPFVHASNGPHGEMQCHRP